MQPRRLLGKQVPSESSDIFLSAAERPSRNEENETAPMAPALQHSMGSNRWVSRATYPMDVVRQGGSRVGQDAYLLTYVLRAYGTNPDQRDCTCGSRRGFLEHSVATRSVLPMRSTISQKYRSGPGEEPPRWCCPFTLFHLVSRS